jgi:hypothetical protein
MVWIMSMLTVTVAMRLVCGLRTLFSASYCSLIILHMFQVLENLAGWWAFSMVTVRRHIIWRLYHEQHYVEDDDKEEGKHDEGYVEPWFVDRFHSDGATENGVDLDTGKVA